MDIESRDHTFMHIQVGVMFHLSQVELKGCTLEKIIYSAILLVQFSTGAIQVRIHRTM